MSEYYLADQRARERSRQNQKEDVTSPAPQGQNMKATLLGDFLIQSGEPAGFDPYNNVHGRVPRDTWRGTRGRR